jgi:AcrR family transcriptional regulator
MAWNTEETRRRLKAAATVEFAAHGLAGTRMDRIAERAGINKERLYNYFRSKERLFALILADEMARIAAAVPAESLRTADIGAYAGRCFDYHQTHPHLVRLLLWESLEYGDGPVPQEPDRVEHYRRKVDAFAAAQRTGAVAGEPAACHLLFLVMAMAAWWAAVPQVARMVTGPPANPSPGEPGETEADAEVTMRRAAVVLAARRMVQAVDAQPALTSCAGAPAGVTAAAASATAGGLGPRPSATAAVTSSPASTAASAANPASASAVTSSGAAAPPRPMRKA